MLNTKPIEHVELEIESIAYEGVSVARSENKVYFVKGGLPGEKVTAKITKKKKSFAEATVVEIYNESPDRIKPECKHFGICGGCSWQNLSYEKQLFWKRDHIVDAFQRIGKISPGEIFNTMPAKKIFEYRNKMEFSFGPSRWLTEDEIGITEDIADKKFALGLHIPGRFDKILNIDECKIEPAVWSEVLVKIREKAVELGLIAYHVRFHDGFLRNLIFRKTELKNEIMAILITTEPVEDNELSFIDWYISEIPKLFPQITHLVHAVNNSFSPVAIGECNHIKGGEFLTESILGVEYRISPFSFFQTNSSQLDNFISKIIEFADLKPTDVVWDLFCGTGSISLPAAKIAKMVYGLELVQSAISDARTNADFNSIKNVKFHCEDLNSKRLYEILNYLPLPDKIIADPPRAGMHKNLAEWLRDSNVPTIVYVSCNPATQARDCQILSENYDVVKIQPVDMFPQTYHIESIALLQRKI